MTRRFEVGADAYRATQTEAQFQQAVISCATHHGWVAVHFRQMVGNPSGWPDLILIRGRRTVFAELKTERGTLGPRQQDWFGRLEEAGADVRVWRPSDWPEIEDTLGGGDGCGT